MKKKKVKGKVGRPPFVKVENPKLDDAVKDVVFTAMHRYGLDMNGRILAAQNLKMPIGIYNCYVAAVQADKNFNIGEARSTIADSVMTQLLDGYNARGFWAKSLLDELRNETNFIFSSCCSARVGVDTIPDDHGKVAKVHVCKSCGQVCEIVKLHPVDRYRLMLESLKHLSEEDVKLAENAAKLKYVNPELDEPMIPGSGHYTQQNTHTVVNNVNIHGLDKVAKDEADKTIAKNTLKPYEIDKMVRVMNMNIESMVSGKCLKIDTAFVGNDNGSKQESTVVDVSKSENKGKAMEQLKAMVKSLGGVE